MEVLHKVRYLRRTKMSSKKKTPKKIDYMCVRNFTDTESNFTVTESHGVMGVVPTLLIGKSCLSTGC